MKKLQVRDYQERAFTHFKRSKAKRLCMTGPTGCGKTVIAARIIADYVKRGKRVLFVVHRRELAIQAFEQIRRGGVGLVDLGVIMGSDAVLASGRERVNPDAAVQVCGIQTLIAREARPPADLVIVDECHRTMADSYQTLLTDYPEARHLGLTATPIRFDGRGLGDFYEELYVIAKPSELIAGGFIVEPRAYTVPERERPELKGLRLSQGDYSLRELEARVNKRSLVGTIVNEVRRHAMNLQTVVFAVGRMHAEHIARQLKRARISCAVLLGDTPQAERTEILRRFEKKEIHVIVNVAVLTEGWDMPVCKCVVIARPTRSLTYYLQMTGRFERPYRGQRPILLDHVGACLRRGFGLPTDEREWKLVTGRESGNGESVAPWKVCPECNFNVPAGALVCSECDYSFPAALPVPDENEEKLEAYRSFRTRLVEFAKQKGAGADWVNMLT